MQTVTYKIPNISCGHCVHTVKTEVGDIQGVKKVEADAATKLATIEFEAPATEAQIIAVLEEINYPPQR